MKAIEKIIEKASALKGTIVLPEGMDARVITAACSCVDRGICTPIVLGTPQEIAEAEAKAGLSLVERNIRTIDYTQGDTELEAAYLEAWNAKEARKPAEKQKIIDIETAQKTLRTKRIYFGGMMVRLGRVNGLVAGSIASTGDMLRAAFHTLGTQKGVKTASSCFIMDLKEPTASGDSVLAFGDCAVIPNPTAEQLVDIGLASAQTYRDLTGNEPRVAFLSFSTKGSAAGDLVEKVQKAVELARPVFAEKGINMDGEMQFDAAIVPSVGQLKNPKGEIQGNANVFIFPDLQAGNIGYKIAQRLGGATAIGPNLQGLAKAMNDLSRGCSAEDIVGTICVTLLQSTTK
ncbi:MAG: phosphate acetyltransferase [Kiritimatiellae bacterium]|nr:phosphate acetyltransferase [Kiritimatiellia bacterium]